MIQFERLCLILKDFVHSEQYAKHLNTAGKVSKINYNYIKDNKMKLHAITNINKMQFKQTKVKAFYSYSEMRED